MQRLLPFRMSCRHHHKMGSTNDNRQLTRRETLTQHLRYVAVVRPQRRICGLGNECVPSPHSWNGKEIKLMKGRTDSTSILCCSARHDSWRQNLQTTMLILSNVCAVESRIPFPLLLLNEHTRAKHAPKMSQDFSELRQDGTKTARVPKKIIDVQHPRAQKKKQATNSIDATTKSFTLLLALDVVSAPLQKQLESLVHL